MFATSSNKSFIPPKKGGLDKNQYSYEVEYSKIEEKEVVVDKFIEKTPLIAACFKDTL